MFSLLGNPLKEVAASLTVANILRDFLLTNKQSILILEDDVDLPCPSRDWHCREQAKQALNLALTVLRAHPDQFSFAYLEHSYCNPMHLSLEPVGTLAPMRRLCHLRVLPDGRAEGRADIVGSAAVLFSRTGTVIHPSVSAVCECGLLGLVGCMLASAMWHGGGSRWRPVLLLN